MATDSLEPKNKVPPAVEGIQQGVQHALLSGRFEIDQRVAAHHQVHLGKRGVRQQILAGKHNALSQVVLDHIRVAALNKKSLQAFL